MGIKVGIKKEIEVEAKTVTIYAKVCDSGNYTLLDSQGETIAELDDYVPNKVIPGDYGDYIDLKIDIETGQITNWKKPSAKDIVSAFKLNGDHDDD